MKVRRTLPCVSLIALLVLSFGACKDGDAPESKTPERSSGQDDYPNFSHLRGLSDTELQPERFLGRGFNLVKHTANDRDGFAKWDVLDKARISADDPWSPFGRPIDSDVYAPEHIEQNEDPREPVHRIQAFFSGRSYSDTLTVSIGGEYKMVTLGYTNKRYTSGETASYIYRSIFGYKYLSEQYDVREKSDYEFFLHKRFVRDLKKLTAAELVEKYGTHLVTSYTTGAFQDLAVAASSSRFTDGEVSTIHAAFWKDKGSLSRGYVKKLIDNQKHIGITYIQAGSDYVPPRPLLSPSLLFDAPMEIAPLDQKAFTEQLRANARSSFFSLEKDNPMIPSLISDIPLKVKYFSGILDLIRPPRVASTMYVLSDPESYVMTPYKTKFLTVMLPRYESQQVFVYIGTGAYQLFEEEGRSMTRWHARMQETGLWTLQSITSRRFLCRDFVLRTAEEDSQNLRFWGLNPAIPTVNGNRYSLANLFIQH